MSERSTFADNPPLEQQVAVMYERMGTFMQATSEKLNRMETMLETALHLRSDVDRQGEWQAKHDIHHGDDDIAVGRRLAHDDSPIGERIKYNEDRIGHLWREVFDGDGRSTVAMLRKAHEDGLTTRGVYVSIWKVVIFVITLPFTGALIGWLGNQAGWW